MRTWLAFGDLSVGESFRFAYGWPHPAPKPDGTVYRKVDGRRLTDGEQTYETGAGTAVARTDPPEAA